MTFINDNQIVAHLAEIDLLSSDHAIACHENSTFLTQGAHLGLPIGFLFVVKLHDVFDLGTPLAEFGLPVHLHGGGDDDENFGDVLAIEQAFAESSDLDSLSKSHVISQHSSLFTLVEVIKPFDSLLLMLEKTLVDFSGQAKVVLQDVLFLFSVVLEATSILTLS